MKTIMNLLSKIESVLLRVNTLTQKQQLVPVRVRSRR